MHNGMQNNETATGLMQGTFSIVLKWRLHTQFFQNNICARPLTIHKTTNSVYLPIASTEANTYKRLAHLGVKMDSK